MVSKHTMIELIEEVRKETNNPLTLINRWQARKILSFKCTTKVEFKERVKAFLGW